MFDLDSETRNFLRRKAAEAKSLISDYYGIDERRKDYPALLVLHPSGVIDVCQGGVVQMYQHPSLGVPVQPDSTEESIAEALMRAWAVTPEMSDYPLNTDWSWPGFADGF